ncbi:Transcription factor RFX4 [Fukomys damarensis]|uniref:Transcription factor RFX4 n=1 Tax=Fukomys damarensis TaxID=885580 RepID=A0A091DJ28_FUKDA|nr:Transcription factor RFX4 [Fukomys damarensis]
MWDPHPLATTMGRKLDSERVWMPLACDGLAPVCSIEVENVRVRNTCSTPERVCQLFTVTSAAQSRRCSASSAPKRSKSKVQLPLVFVTFATPLSYKKKSAWSHRTWGLPLLSGGQPRQVTGGHGGECSVPHGLLSGPWTVVAVQPGDLNRPFRLHWQCREIIRQQFPQLTTRRLGTRGQSKYHYYGIAVKESSQYYDVMYSKKGAAWVSEAGKKEVSKQAVAYSPRSRLGTLLPEFPKVKDLNLPASLPEEKSPIACVCQLALSYALTPLASQGDSPHPVLDYIWTKLKFPCAAGDLVSRTLQKEEIFATSVSTFIMMYRTHCQRILDTVIRANFDEVQSFLLHFWQGMPPHMLPVLGSSTVVHVVGVCDSILYKAISGVLMPTVLQALPDSLTQVIRKFAKQLDEWLKVALHDLPENLRNIKFELSRRFSQVLRRQTSLNHLCQASRTVIHSADITFQMLEDWRNVDLNSITKQTLYTMEDPHEEHRKLIIQLYQEFDHLLEGQSPIESYVEWLDTMVDRCVVKVAAKRQGSLKKVAQQFLLMWSCFGTRVIRDMTLHSAPSFGSFHLIHLMFDDYVLYLLESLHCQERANELMRAMKGEGGSAELREEIILTEATPPTPSPVPSFSPTKSATSVEVPPPSSPVSNPSPEYTGLSTTGAMQSYTWSLTYTVTTAAGSPAEHSQQLPCVRNTPVPASSVAHRIPVYPHREEHGYTGSYNYGSYGNQHPHAMQSQYPALPHDTAISGPLHYSPYHRSSAQYPFSSPTSRTEPCLMSSTPRLHPTAVAPRWPEVPTANACYTSPPVHSARYGNSSDMYTPLSARRNSEYEHIQHFPGFAYINGEASTGWAK